MRNGDSIYEEQYKRMNGRPDRKRALQLFNVMGDYLKFYEQWVKTCVSLNRKVENPNRSLARRWWKS